MACELIFCFLRADCRSHRKFAPIGAKCRKQGRHCTDKYLSAFDRRPPISSTTSKPTCRDKRAPAHVIGYEGPTHVTGQMYRTCL